MHDIWMRFMENLSHRVGGTMRFRFILQPTMALIFATIDGLKDAKSGKAPYFWSLFTEPQHRIERLKHGWKSVGKVFVLAIVLDVIFQIRELDSVSSGGGSCDRPAAGDRAVPPPARPCMPPLSEALNRPP